MQKKFVDKIMLFLWFDYVPNFVFSVVQEVEGKVTLSHKLIHRLLDSKPVEL